MNKNIIAILAGVALIATSGFASARGPGGPGQQEVEVGSPISQGNTGNVLAVGTAILVGGVDDVTVDATAIGNNIGVVGAEVGDITQGNTGKVKAKALAVGVIAGDDVEVSSAAIGNNVNLEGLDASVTQRNSGRIVSKTAAIGVIGLGDVDVSATSVGNSVNIDGCTTCN